mgnify:CR=1 FL=1
MLNKPIIYAFIDSQNLNFSIRNIGWKLDFKKFLIYLKEKYQVSRAYMFMGYFAENSGIYRYLREVGYIVILKPTIGQKGNCDAELVLYSMIEYYNFEKAILISGDWDFYCLVKYLVDNDKLFKLGIPNKYRYSALLRKFSRFHFYVNKLRHRLEYKN